MAKKLEADKGRPNFSDIMVDMMAGFSGSNAPQFNPPKSTNQPQPQDDVGLD